MSVNMGTRKFWVTGSGEVFEKYDSEWEFVGYVEVDSDNLWEDLLEL